MDGRPATYHKTDVLPYVKSNMPKIMLEKKDICDQIIQTVNNGIKQIFLEAPRETGKTFLITLLLSMIRS